MKVARLISSVIFAAGLGLLIIATMPSNSQASDNVVQGYLAKGTIQPGMIVALTKDDKTAVEPVPPKDSSRIFGVVIDPSDAPLTLNRQIDSQVFVANTGTYPVLVSTERGEIHNGDYLSVSSIAGISAIATPDQHTVIGRAAQNFDGKKDVITTISGAKIGKVSVNVDPTRKNPLVKNDLAVPSFLKTAGDAIAGKPVSGVKIYLAVIILLAATVITVAVLASGVRGGMIALGRNPLNRSHIMNSMFKVVTAGVMVFIIGIFGVYLLLKI